MRVTAFIYFKIPDRNISIPIKIRIIPPKTVAFPERAVPNFLPIKIPAKQIINVMSAMIRQQRNAFKNCFAI